MIYLHCISPLSFQPAGKQDSHEQLLRFNMAQSEDDKNHCYWPTTLKACMSETNVFGYIPTCYAYSHVNHLEVVSERTTMYWPISLDINQLEVYF